MCFMLIDLCLFLRTIVLIMTYTVKRWQTFSSIVCWSWSCVTSPNSASMEKWIIENKDWQQNSPVFWYFRVQQKKNIYLTDFKLPAIKNQSDYYFLQITFVIDKRLWRLIMQILRGGEIIPNNWENQKHLKNSERRN